MPKTDAPVLKDLQPGVIWEYFEQLTKIPRPSKEEQKVRAWVKGIAEKHGWPVREDSTGNMIVQVPATPGCEKAAPLVLQSHLDMVCEKNSDVVFDFQRDPLRLRIEGDLVKAVGTTLGADNGIGVCAMLAAATSPDVRHGPLELLFTIDEETGLTGATAVSPDLIRARRMINLDSEEDDVLYIGCAGGQSTMLRWSGTMSPIESGWTCATASVSGLRGGHSGAEIHEGRGNSIKLLARALARAEFPLRLARFVGGNKHNAIPREAEADVWVASGHLKNLRDLIADAQKKARRQFEAVDADVTIAVTEKSDAKGAALSPEDSRRLVDVLTALPHGVLGLSRAIPGLVESSNNIAVIAWKADAAGGQAQVEVLASSRSSSAPELTAVTEQVAGVARLAGWSATLSDGYPGWSPNPDSPLLKVCRRVYAEHFGEEPKVTAIHAGLECGVIGERVGGMDMISFGPTIKNPHSPDESVSIRSVQKFWQYLGAVLAALT